MARQAEQQPTAGKINRTPAPDEISHVRGPSPAGYGQNNDPNPSSIESGRRVVSPLGQNLESSMDDGGALARVIAQGTARQDSSITSQLRDIAPGNVPDAFGMASARSRQATYPGPRGVVPATTAKSNAQPIRKPS
jgi:hypothetical protein